MWTTCYSVQIWGICIRSSPSKVNSEHCFLVSRVRLLKRLPLIWGTTTPQSAFFHSGWCQAALPHKRLDDDQIWQISTTAVTLLVEPGSRPGANAATRIGVPYGSRARLIMFYLQSESLRTNSRQVQLGRSMRDWLSRMGVPIGGKSLISIRDQAERISRCRLSINVHNSHDNRHGFSNQNIIDGAIFLDPGTQQGSLFIETAHLSETFFAELKRHPVPLEEAAIRAISNNSLALDLYAWLAYRLHVLKAPTPVSWAALRSQFGTGFNAMNHFRATFLQNLHLALAVYPDAKIAVTDRGMDLHPSKRACRAAKDHFQQG